MNPSIHWFEQRVCLTPNEPAVTDSSSKERWTYRELDTRALRLAATFRARGVKKGDRVALLAPNHICYFDFMLACKKIGAIFVPLNWRLAKKELDEIIEDCAPALLGVFSTWEKGWYVETIKVDSSDYIPSGSLYTPEEEVDFSDPWIIVYTGGTTGKPKGAVLSHRSIIWNSLNTIVTWDLSQEDTTLTTLPMFHTGGLNVFTIPFLVAGGLNIISPEFEPVEAVRNLIQYKCTTALFVPTMYHMITETDIFKTSTFPHLKVLVSGGAPCPEKVYDAFRKKGISFKQGYGLTEAGPNNFFIRSDDKKSGEGSVGKPMIFTEVKLIDDEGNDIVDSAVGELVIRGPHVFEYYWNNTDESKQVFQGEWFYTGDLARRDDEGYYYIVGRKKEMIITGGENVYPLEIEQLLETYELIDEVAVVGRHDDKWGEVVTAFYTSDGDVDRDELKRFCKNNLAGYKVPRLLQRMETLPKTHVGKIDKQQLKNALVKFGG